MIMNSALARSICCTLGLVSLIAWAPCARAQFTPPTQEELQMTSQPEVPGAPAVYLFREESTDDHLHAWSKYVRLKVLNEEGKSYANVELTQFAADDNWGYSSLQVTNIEGRTIHPDGTVIPFTGKPYQKVLEKSKGLKVTAKVFTLPDVEVGSIIEYRYTLRWDDDRYIAPQWLIQSDLFTRKAHYVWKPTNKILVTRDEKGEQLTSRILWTRILPPGTDVKDTQVGGAGPNGDPQEVIDLQVHDVPPVPQEDYMPPVRSFSYRVLFYYSPYSNEDEYWKNTGKGWSKSSDKFIGPGRGVTSAVQSIIAGANTQDEKLHKIYDAVMQLENTTLSGSKSGEDDKGKALLPPKDTDEVWERKRGTDDQITELFIAMARAAGMKAYLMTIPNRDRTLFTPAYLSFSQFDDDIAIVNVDGKERFFDPGQRYCRYGHLAWRHSINRGLRQTDNGTAVAETSEETYMDSRVDRIADLQVDEHGLASGTVRLTWTGAPALRWRQESLRGDATELNDDLEKEAESMLPGSMEVKLLSVGKIQDYEQPLTVAFTVKGSIGTGTGKRLILPSDVFEVNTKPAFPHPKRDVAVYFEYPVGNYDATRFTFPSTLAVESQPPAVKLPLLNSAQYSMDSKATPNSVTFYRNLVRATVLYIPSEYQDLRTFYNKLETADQQPLILKAASTTTAQLGGN